MKRRISESALILPFIKRCLIEDRSLLLPSRDECELDVRTYGKFKGLMESIGGRYVLGQNRFVFDFDPSGLVARLGEGENYARSLQFYPTPPEAAALVTDHLQVGRGLRFLEPSAGRGALIEAILRTPGLVSPAIDACEIDPFNRELLCSKGVHLVGDDFLQYRSARDRKYDAVVLNPPFRGETYMRHIEHAYEHLKPGGQMLFYAPSAWLDAERGSRAAAFADFVTSRAGVIEDLGRNAFAESGVRIGTVFVFVASELWDLDYTRDSLPVETFESLPDTLELAS
ncbi:class I SAM-dependent methyltransferase [Pseudomonas aeruginosa]|uniref:class I SAM-dependent methyltransferase n=1 Tax=Pseudomonas aeruginosa TaxID=287 RepID=UPI0030F1F916